MKKDSYIKRSDGILQTKRFQNNWPHDESFRILSLDGGGARGIFLASFLNKLESKHLEGRITDYFDLICGTSTGGIISLGLGAGIRISEIEEMYKNDSKNIFQKPIFSKIRSYFQNKYKNENLKKSLKNIFGNKKLENSKSRLCIPSFDGHHGEVYVFKTPHHQDYVMDGKELMTNVALAASAAPSFFKPFYHSDGYVLVDGGVWANNPCMIGVVEALSAFNIKRDNIKVLSIGCDHPPYTVTQKMARGGKWQWRYIIDGAIRLQNQNAVGQAGLLVGRSNLLRIDILKEITKTIGSIELDDWKKSLKYSSQASISALEKNEPLMRDMFFKKPVKPYKY